MGQAQHDPAISVTFSAAWWCQHYGMHSTRDIWSDPIQRTEFAREQERLLFERFGDIGLGSPDPPARPHIQAYGDRFMAALWGCEIEYRPDQAPAAIPFADAWGRMETLRLPDLSASAVVAKAFSDARTLEERYGHCDGNINFGGPLNNAVSVFGEEVLIACAAEPELAQRVLYLAAQLILAAFDTIACPINGVDPIAAKSGGYGLGNCPVCMIAPQTYREVVLPVDQWLCGQFSDRPGLHHCGIFHPYIDVYQALRPSGLDIGWGSDIAMTRRAYPDIPIAMQVHDAALIEMDADAIDQLIQRMVLDGGPKELIPVIWVAEVGPDIPDLRIRDLMTVFSRVQVARNAMS